MNLFLKPFTVTHRTNTAKQRLQQRHNDKTAKFSLLEGILEANGAELSLLLEATLELLQMHHAALGTRSNTNRAYRRLMERLDQLEEPSVPWVDLLWSDRSGGIANPDGPAIRELIQHVARTTLIQALVSCVAVQRRFVTGKIYGPGVREALLHKAQVTVRVRYTAYRPVPETDVEGLMAYIHDHEHIQIAKTIETLAAARHWVTVVMPDIRRHYQGLSSTTKTHT